MLVAALLQANRPFITTWDTTKAGSASDTIIIPTVSTGTYGCIVYWGDGNVSNITTYNDPAWTHVYSGSGTYTVTIYGTFTGFRFNGAGDRLKLITITQWGIFRSGNVTAVFSGCSNLTISAIDVPNLGGCTTLANFFSNCTAITTIPNLPSWNMVGVTSLSSFLSGCTSFNQNVSAWNLSTVGSINGLFSTCTLFNQPCTWDTSNISSMQTTFASCPAFNQPLAWNTSKVTNMLGTFSGATIFNQSLSSWDTSLVVTFQQFLQNAAAFNQSLSTFNTANVTNMSNMFMGATSFNQSLSTFNTSKVTNMSSMFSGATAFDQNIGSWDITKLVSGATGGTNMFLGVTLSTANYNALLAGWGAQVPLTGVTFNGGNSHYDATTGGNDGIAGRAVLTGTYSWSISDAGTP